MLSFHRIGILFEYVIHVCRHFVDPVGLYFMNLCQGFVTCFIFVLGVVCYL